MRTLVFALATLMSAPVWAGPYLIDPAGGVSLFFSDPDNGVRPVARPLGFAANFFNEAVTGVHPAVNGELAWTGAQGATTGYGPADAFGLPTAVVRRIAPAWDNLLMLVDDSVIEKRANTGGSVYYSVTWTVHKFGETSASPPSMEFQSVIFGATQTVRGFTFLADDIAFSYKTLSSPQGGFLTLGLQEGTGSNRVAFADGTFPLPFGVYDQVGDIPILATSDKFILFRRNVADGSYTSSIESVTAAVPEPASAALFALGAMALAIRVRQRRCAPAA